MFTKKINFLVIFFIVFCLQCFAKHNGDYLNKVTTKYITPHLLWAKPLSGGKLKCLFLVPRQGAREVVEIWQRLDIEYDAFTAWWPGELAKEDNYELSVEGTSIKEKKREILEKLEKDYDVIVVSIGFDILPAEARYKIFEKAYKGTGIVFFNPESRVINKKYKKIFSEKLEIDLFNHISFDGVPEFKKENYSLYKYGEGRIILMRGGCEGYTTGYYQGLSLTIPRNYSRFWKFYYENNMALVAKAILFAAKREPVYSVECLNLNNGQIFKQKELPLKLDFNLKRKQSDTPYNLSIVFRVRDTWNDVCYSETVKLVNRIGFSLNIPFLKHGMYTLDYLILNKENKIENFGYYTFTVSSEIGNLIVDIPKNFYEKKEIIKGKILIENPLDAECEILVELISFPDKKIWFQKLYKINPGQKELEFEISCESFPAITGYIKAELKKTDNILIKGEKEIFFPEREMPLYPSFVWSFSGCPYPEFYYPQLIKAGFDAVQENPELAAKFNLRTWPMLTRIMLWVNRKIQDQKKGWTQLVGIDKMLGRYEEEIKKINPSVDSKKIIEKGDLSFYNPIIKSIFRENIKKAMLASNLYCFSPLFYNLGDENFYMIEGGYSPCENEEFIKFLKEKYKKIENLNKAWEENFKNFEEVKHYSIEEMKTLKKYATYCDHHMFMAKQYADVHHTASEVIKEIAPYAYVGAEGSPAGDIEYVTSKLDVWGPYSSKVENELIRSIARNKIRTIWWGGYVGTHGGRNFVPTPLWTYLLSGIVNGNSFFMAGPWSEGFLSIDLSYAEYFESMFPHLMKLENGIAQTLIVNSLKNYGIAVLYSFPSEIISKFGEKRFISLSESCSHFIDFCYSNGFNFDFLTPSMIENNFLKDYKILLLFGATAISPETKKKIEEFVYNGGVIIADVNPGIMNENCKLLEKGQFSEIFQEFKTVEEFTSRDIEVKRSIYGPTVNISLKNLFCAAEEEIFQVSQYGKGYGILLNFTLKSLFNSMNNQEEFNKFLAFLLSLCGIEKDVEIKDFKGMIGRIAMRENPEFKILGILLYTGAKGEKLRVSFKNNEDFYVYKVDEGFFGKSNILTEQIQSYPHLLLFSLFEQKQDIPYVSLQKSEIKRGEKIYLKFEEKRNRIYRVQLLLGNNEIYNKIIQSEKTDLEIPIAYNEIPGVYSLTITDVITGLKNIINVKII